MPDALLGSDKYEKPLWNLHDILGLPDWLSTSLELTTSWDVNSSLNFETGWTHLFKGAFAKQATSAPNTQDVAYFYVKNQFRF